jgi:hypothetical protein
MTRIELTDSMFWSMIHSIRGTDEWDECFKNGGLKSYFERRWCAYVEYYEHNQHGRIKRLHFIDEKKALEFVLKYS